MSTSRVQTDGHRMAEATAKPWYVVVVTQATPVAAGSRNKTSGGPEPDTGCGASACVCLCVGFFFFFFC